VPAVITTTEEREERVQKRRATRAAAARRRYAENLEAERLRCKTAKQVQRRHDGSQFKPTPGVNYDAADYAEEWMFLTWLGVRADDIIAGSRPSRDWFNDNVLPLVTRSLCSTCGEEFNPQHAGMLARCARNCGARRPRNHPWWN
jgi:hypothetical protein